MGKLEYPFRSRQILQSVHPKIAELDSGGEVLPDQFGRRSRQQRLPPMADGAQSGAPVHHRPIEVGIALLHIPGMDRDPHRQGDGQRPGLGRNGSLQLQGSGDRRCRAVEDAEGAVALTLGLDQPPPMVGYRLRHQAIMASQGSFHRLMVGFPQAGRAFDIGKQEGKRHQPEVGWQIGRRASMAADDSPALSLPPQAPVGLVSVRAIGVKAPLEHHQPTWRRSSSTVLESDEAVEQSGFACTAWNQVAKTHPFAPDARARPGETPGRTALALDT
jgi:hypothetical protein